MTREAESPAVILVRPQEEGNIGAVARAMANMGLDELILVAPQCDLGHTAAAFAVHSTQILEACRTYDEFAEAVAPFQLSQSPVSPRELPALLAADPPTTRTALVFGGERSGLSTDELALCDPLVTIPASVRQPTLNLSQAVLVLAYELWTAAGVPAEPQVLPTPAAVVADVEGLFGQLEPLLHEIGFARDDTFRSVLRDLRRLAARAALTEHEVIILRGICRRGHNALR
jgi:tRNA/rRNA methyltransferase